MQNETNQNSLDLPEVEPCVNAEALPGNDSSAPIGLKAVREARRMSPGDVAYALKVSPRVIDAIEAGRWSDLPGRTFAVGILRAYGRLLETPVDALVETIPGATSAIKKTMSQSAPAPAASQASRRGGEAKGQTRTMMKSGLLMVLVAVLLAYAVPSGFWDEAVQSAQTVYERLMDSATGAAKQNVVAENNPAAPAPAPNAESTASTTPTTQTEQPQTGTGTLELRFTAPAWVEVRDYTGRIIYSQLNAAGTTQFITGTAPLDIMIGNARQVQARWRDEPVKLDKLSGDDVARQVLR